jgi:putative sterol carrier protein
MQKMLLLAEKLQIDSFVVTAPGYIEEVNFKPKIAMAKQEKSRFSNEAQEVEMSKGFYSFEIGECVVFTDLVKGEITQDGKTKVIYKAREEETGDLWTFPTHIKLSMKLNNLLDTFAGENQPFEVCFTGSEPVQGDPKKKNYIYRVRY